MNDHGEERAIFPLEKAKETALKNCSSNRAKVRILCLARYPEQTAFWYIFLLHIYDLKIRRAGRMYHLRMSLTTN